VGLLRKKLKELHGKLETLYYCKGYDGSSRFVILNTRNSRTHERGSTYKKRCIRNNLKQMCNLKIDTPKKGDLELNST